jgi:hypothetical protein
MELDVERYLHIELRQDGCSLHMLRDTKTSIDIGEFVPRMYILDDQVSKCDDKISRQRITNLEVSNCKSGRKYCETVKDASCILVQVF